MNKDKARLDWMIKRHGNIWRSNGRYLVCSTDDGKNIHSGISCYARKAIDAAMKSESRRKRDWD